MDISRLEPLGSLLDTSEAKQQDLMRYLPDETREQLGSHEYTESDDIYLNEHLICVSKQTGLLVHYGKLLKNTGDTLTLRQGYRNIYVPISGVYLFRKTHGRNTAKNDRDFYEALLNIF